MANLEDFFFFNEEKKLNPNPMNVPSSHPPQVAYRKCVAESVVVEPFGPPAAPPQCFFLLEPPPPPLSALSMACCNGAGRKGKERKEGRKRVWRRRRLSSSSACVSVCAQFGRHLETRSQRQQRPSLIFSRCYIYSQKKATYFVNWKF